MSEHQQRPTDHVVEPLFSGLKQHELRPKKSVPVWKIVVALLVFAALAWVVSRQAF